MQHLRFQSHLHQRLNASTGRVAGDRSRRIVDVSRQLTNVRTSLQGGQVLEVTPLPVDTSACLARSLHRQRLEDTKPTSRAAA